MFLSMTGSFVTRVSVRNARRKIMRRISIGVKSRRGEKLDVRVEPAKTFSDSEVLANCVLWSSACIVAVVYRPLEVSHCVELSAL